MRKWVYNIAIVIAVILTAVMPVMASTAESSRAIVTLRVVVSTSDLEGIVRAVGGDYVEISTILPAGANPHDYSVPQSTMQSISDADLIVLLNSDFLHYEESVKENYPSKTYTDWDDYVAKGAALHKFPGYDDGCPHGYWFHFTNAKAIAKAVEKKLSAIDPGNEDYYNSNLQRFIDDVDRATEDIAKLSSTYGVAGAKVVTAVPGVNYIVENAGMVVAATLMQEGSGFVSGSTLQEIEDKLASGEYKAIVCPESMKNAKAGEIARQISLDTGARVIYLRFISEENAKSFISQMYYNSASLITGVYGENTGVEKNVPASATKSSDFYMMTSIMLLVLVVIEAYMIYVYRKRLMEDIEDDTGGIPDTRGKKEKGRRE